MTSGPRTTPADFPDTPPDMAYTCRAKGQEYYGIVRVVGGFRAIADTQQQKFTDYAEAKNWLKIMFDMGL